MGREVKRVALDFTWPLNRPYSGFMLPKHLQPDECPDCENGYAPDAYRFYQQWYGYVEFDPVAYGSELFTPDSPGVREAIRRKINFDANGTDDTINFYTSYGRFTEDEAVERETLRMCDIWNSQWSNHLRQDEVDALVDSGRLMDFTHDWENGKGWTPKVSPVRPTAAEINLWSLFGMGHVSINCGSAIAARCEREGVPVRCTTCGGEAHVFRDDKHRADYDNWQSEEPPVGEGWQMWENTSEGSPISPVFDTPEKLAEWLTANNASAFGSDTASYDQWLTMIVGPGYAPSAIFTNGKLLSGVAAGSE